MKKKTLCLLLLIAFIFAIPCVAQATQIITVDGKDSQIRITGTKLLIGTHPDDPEYHRQFTYAIENNVGWITREYRNNHTYVYLNMSQYDFSHYNNVTLWYYYFFWYEE